MTARYRHIRSVITRLQARCRGYYVRRFQQKERWAIVFIQRKVREMIARRKAVRRKIEEKARKEIHKEEKELEKKYGKKKAREMSEKKLQEVILRLEREE